MPNGAASGDAGSSFSPRSERVRQLSANDKEVV
jgi:hypothetical protein